MKTEKVKKVFSNLVVILSIAVLGSLLFTGVTTGRPNVFGYRVFYIMSESMEPTIMTGQLAVAHKIDAEEVEVGDIVAYDRGDIIIIHRVTDIDESETGRVFTFQGDNNDFADEPVTAEQIMYEIVVY